MKHTPKITFILLAIFLLAQFIGIGIVYQYIDPIKSAETGKTEFKELPIGERPPIEETISFIPIILAVLIGTGLLLLVIKFKLNALWRIWFLLAVVIALLVAFTPFVNLWVAATLALILGFWKIFRPNFWVQNLTELFVYGGLAAIFVPIFNLFSVIILLILISVYDAYAVWKSKHMITLAKSQARAKIFAGLLIPYQISKKVRGKTIKKKGKKVLREVRTAILGGGDIGFPLIFAGVVMKEWGLWPSLMIPFFATLGLAFLFWKSQEKKYYPAMPFLSAGCFIGLGIVWLIGLLV